MPRADEGNEDRGECIIYNVTVIWVSVPYALFGKNLGRLLQHRLMIETMRTGQRSIRHPVAEYISHIINSRILNTT